MLRTVAIQVAVECLLLMICVREFTCLKFSDMSASLNLIFYVFAHAL